MRKLITVALMCFMSLMCNAQTSPASKVCEAYAYSNMLYNSNKGTYDNIDQNICSFPVILFEDKIMIMKKDENATYFFTSLPPIKTEKNGNRYFEYIAYDESNYPCSVKINTNPLSFSVAITYDRAVRHLYMLKTKN